MKKKHLLLSAMVCIIAALTSHAQNVPNYVPQNGLVGWWPFNGNANDESGNGNNGTVNGATLTTDRFGNANKAYSFDGVDDFITGSASTFPLGNNSRAISGWAYKTSLPTSTFADVIFLYGINSSGGWFGPINGKPDDIYTIGLSQNGVSNDFHVHHNYSLNTWYHYTITYNIDTVKLYINSELVGVEVINPINTGSGKFFIGSAISDSYFEGRLDDIGIWNRALSEEEIKNIYNGNICYRNVTVTDTLLINTAITGFNPITYQNTIKVYPNPSKDQITVDFGNFNTLNGYQLKITNSIGQQMYQTAINKQSVNISLGSWTGKGLYIIQIIDKQGTITDTRKIMIQ